MSSTALSIVRPWLWLPLLAALVSCPEPPSTPAPSAVEPAVESVVQPRADQPPRDPLAELPLEGTEPQPDGPVLRIASDRMTLGETIILLDGFAVPEAAARGLLVTPLFDALRALHDDRKAATARARPDAPGAPPGRLLLSIAPDVPYDLVTRALYTAGQAEFDDIAAIVRTADGARILPLPMPKLGVAGPDDAWSCGDLCSSAETSVHSTGAQVIARQTPSGDGLMVLADRALEPVFGDKPDGQAATLLEGVGVGGLGLGAAGKGGGPSPERRGPPARALLRQIKGPTTPTPALDALFAEGMARTVEAKAPTPAKPKNVVETAADWRGALMLSAAGVCPSVPRKAERIDRAALTRLLKAVYAIQPGCTRATVGAAAEMPWQDVADVLQVHRALSHVPVVIAADAESATADCKGGMVVPDKALTPIGTVAPRDTVAPGDTAPTDTAPTETAAPGDKAAPRGTATPADTAAP